MAKKKKKEKRKKKLVADSAAADERAPARSAAGERDESAAPGDEAPAIDEQDGQLAAGYAEAARDPGPRTLSIDIGGTGIKALILSSKGERLSDRVRVPTPKPARPDTVLDALADLVATLPYFDRVSVGFPGVVRDGRTFTAPNLDGESWRDVDLASSLGQRLSRPVRVLNDADLQGLGVIEGKGIEMVVTLGTGFGCGIYRDGRVAPHLELGHHAFRKGETYEEQLSDKTLKRIGKRKWNRRLERAIASLRKLVNFDRLYIGGGNARHIGFELDPDVVTVSNVAGLHGGIALWRDEDQGRRAWLQSGGSPEVL